MLTSFFKKLTGSKFLVLLGAICLSLGAKLSAQEIEWQNTIGGWGNEEHCFIRQTPDGGFILGGSSPSNIGYDKTENSMGFQDYWIVKTDGHGNIQWQNTIGGNSSDNLQALELTTDGGYIIGGSSLSDSSGDKSINSKGGFDYWVVKIDSIGNIQWENTIGGDSADYLLSLDPTVDGGYIVGGYSYSNISGDKTENSMGYSDYWIVKVDSTGNVQWDNTLGGSYYENYATAQQTSDGGYIVGGSSQSGISGDKTEANIGTSDYWIIKISSTGIIQWQNTIGGNSGDRLYSIQQNIEGGYILMGYSSSDISGDKNENCIGGIGDIWIIKTDNAGNITAQNTIGGTSFDGQDFMSVQQTSDNGYILACSSQSDQSGDKTENCIGGVYWDYWIVKVDSNLTFQWDNTIGGDGPDKLSSIVQTSDGGFMIGGYSGSDASADKLESNIGNGNGMDDYWIVKITNKFNLVTGKAFLDLNGNSFQEINEPAIAQKKIMEQNSGRFVFTNSSGFYRLVVLDSGSHTVQVPNNLMYYNAVPGSHNTYFNSLFQTDSLNDFAYQPSGTFNDLCVTITPLGPFRAGFNANYMINYENVGTTTLNGDVIFFPFNNVTYVTSNVTPFSVTTDSIIWQTGMLAPFQTGSIVVTVNVNAPIGALINSSVRIEPVAGDANPGCNYHAWEVFVTGSFDPNDILVSEDTLTTTQLATQPFLDYTIRFQNTGNDTAFTVKIINPIDTNKLELSSIESVNSSHPVQLKWVNYNRNMEFLFENILLPDSNINEPQSHGFITYRIKPKTSLLAGESITNKAYIYFDFNAPVETNTATTKIILPTSINELTKDNWQLTLFPNPAKDELNIQLNNSKANNLITVSIFDVLGNTVLSKQSATAYCKLPTAHFSKGIYFVEVKTGKEVYRSKFVKE